MAKYIKKVWKNGKFRYYYDDGKELKRDKIPLNSKETVEYKNSKKLFNSKKEIAYMDKNKDGNDRLVTKTVKNRGLISQFTDKAIDKGRKVLKKNAKRDLYDLNYKKVSETRAVQVNDPSVKTKGKYVRLVTKEKVTTNKKRR